MFQKLRNHIRSIRKKRRLTAFYKSIISEGDLCFDIGANMGERTDIFLKLGARVIAVEPVEESIKTLKKRFKSANGLTILPYAISHKAEKRKMYISNYSALCTLSTDFIDKYQDQPSYDIRWDEQRWVETKTLDQLIQEYGLPTFCKIDVEGLEKEVFEGLSHPIPMISFEYNARLKQSALDCLTLLTQWPNLCFNFSPYETMSFTLSEWVDHTSFFTYIQELSNEIKTGDIYVRQDHSKSCQSK